MTLKDYHSAIGDIWHFFKEKYSDPAPDWGKVAQDGEKIVRKYGHNLFVKDMVFACWNELDRYGKEQLSLKDELYKGE